MKSHSLFPFAAVTTLAITLLCVAAPALEGTFAIGAGPTHTAWVGAGVSEPRDGLWTALNPAAIVDLNRRLDLSIAGILTDITMYPRGIGANPLHREIPDEDLYGTGTASLVVPTQCGTWSVAFWTPSGVGVTFPHSRNLFSMLLGNRDRRLTYEHARLGAAYAYEFDNGWALGIEAHASISRFRTDHLTLKLTSAQADYDYDEALGGGLGIGVYKTWEKLSFGASYHSREWVDEFNEYDDLLKHSVDLPQYFQTGIGYEVAPWLTIIADYKWIDWSGVSQHGDAPMGDAAELLSMNPVAGGFGREDQHIVKLAFESPLNGKWIVRGGYSRALTDVIPDDQVFLNSLVPTLTRDHFALGAAYKVNDRWEIQATWLHAVDREMEENGRGDLLSKLGKGSRIESGSDEILLGCSYTF
ncbi:MAG: hypothetical protein K1Y02_06645 [Candidatus Hydrogenedentes bacterium]|nr:hypothetical protein [Candidatus Hydrogenedentota bacterium]